MTARVTASTACVCAVTVNDRGEVHVHGRLYGWVDRWDRTGSSSTWRWVRDGGATSPTRFRTRREAVADLAEQP